MLTKPSSTFAITIHSLSIIKHKIFKNPALPRTYTAVRKKKHKHIWLCVCCKTELDSTQMFNLQLLESHLIIPLYKTLTTAYFHLRVASINAVQFNETFIHNFKTDFHFVVILALRKHFTVNFRGIPRVSFLQ